jgi:hypothetical protein
MKKPKINFDAAQLQRLLLLHIEKLLLGVFVLLMLLLIWQGWRLRGMETKQPKQLLTSSQQAMQKIDDVNRWNEIRHERESLVDFNVEREVREMRLPTDPVAYALPNSLHRPDFPKLNPRLDPEVLPPIHLVVRPMVGPLAGVYDPSRDEQDPLYPATDASAPKRRPPPKKTKTRNLAGLEGEGYTPGPGSADGGGATRRTRGRTKGGEELAGLSGEGSAGADGGYGYGRGGYGIGGAGMTGGLHPEAYTTGFQVQSPESTVARDSASVTIMAVVPLQKQIEEFENKLASALDYDPSRDFPMYLQFQVERADVTELPAEADPSTFDWKRLPSPRTVLREQVGDETTPGKWAGIPMEVVDPAYLDPEVLTHPAPPYLARDLWDLLTHPEVPLASVMAGYGEVPQTTAGAEAPKGDDDLPSMRAMPPPGAAGGMAGMGGPGSADGGYRAMPGMRGAYPGYGAAGMGSDGGYGRGGYGAAGMMPGGYPGRAGMPGGYGRPGAYGEDGGYGYGGYGAMGAVSAAPPKYKLIRYTDTNVERGRKYRYRIRVYLHDPNHPNLAWGFFAPSAASLHPDVQQRVKKLDAEDAKRPKDATTGLPFRTYWLISEWSEPSPIAELPLDQRVYAGKITARAPAKIRGLDVQLNEPIAEALAVVFDRTKVADIPAPLEKVARGAVLHATQDVKVIHPVTKEVIDLPKFTVATDCLIADMMGGEALRPVDRTLPQPMTAVGEMLVMDPLGRLTVRNEADDIDMYRRFTVPKTDPNQPPATGPGGPLPGYEEGGRPPRGRAAIRGSPGCF